MLNEMPVDVLMYRMTHHYPPNLIEHLYELHKLRDRDFFDGLTNRLYDYDRHHDNYDELMDTVWRMQTCFTAHS